MLYIYPTPKYPRSPLEARMKTIYTLANAMTGIALVVLITEYFCFLANCMPDYYTKKELVLTPNLEYIISNCTYYGELNLMNAKATLAVHRDGIVVGLMQCAQYITALLALTFVTLIVNALSLNLFRAGNRHARIFGVHLSLYHALVALSYFINSTIIGTTFSFDTQRRFYQRALAHCESVARENDVVAFWNSEYTGYTIFSVAVYWPLGAACANILIYLASFIVRCINSNDKADLLLSQADAPWESAGVKCATSKPLLRLHTTQRQGIIDEANEAMRQGMKVRIVRSYQLLTEEDYLELVEAMRQQVDENIKEEQLELLRQNFGEDEGAWDQTGFKWHDEIPWRLPSPLTSEEDDEEDQVVDGEHGEGGNADAIIRARQNANGHGPMVAGTTAAADHYELEPDQPQWGSFGSDADGQGFEEWRDDNGQGRRLHRRWIADGDGEPGLLYDDEEEDVDGDELFSPDGPRRLHRLHSPDSGSGGGGRRRVRRRRRRRPHGEGGGADFLDEDLGWGEEGDEEEWEEWEGQAEPYFHDAQPLRGGRERTYREGDADVL